MNGVRLGGSAPGPKSEPSAITARLKVTVTASRFERATGVGGASSETTAALSVDGVTETTSSGILKAVVVARKSRRKRCETAMRLAFIATTHLHGWSSQLPRSQPSLLGVAADDVDVLVSV